MVLFGVEEGDREEYVDAFVQKIVHLRIFSDEAGKLNLSLLDQGYSVLAVPTSPSAPTVKRGGAPPLSARPAPTSPPPASTRWRRVCGRPGAAEVVCGRFGADMAVDLVNDGPVTLILDSAEIVKQ